MSGQEEAVDGKIFPYCKKCHTDADWLCFSETDAKFSIGVLKKSFPFC